VKILHIIARAVPLFCYKPFRIGVVHFRRGSMLRMICVLVVKLGAAAYRNRRAGFGSDIRPLDAKRFVFCSVDSMVMDAIFWTGVQGYEGMVADVWVRLCRRARAVLEVGGNIGLFTVIGADAFTGRYTVVEPVPKVAAVLRENLVRNGLARVEVLQAAAIPGEMATEVTLNIPDEGRSAPVGSHLTEGVEVEERSSANRIQVQGLPFRDLIAGRDLVKIDAEGIEAVLLESAHDIILDERPTLLIEILPSATHLAKLISELARMGGYEIYIIPEWGSDTIVSVTPDEFNATLPVKYNSKDIVLSTVALQAAG
jgi:FkbM family methyltransferase